MFPGQTRVITFNTIANGTAGQVLTNQATASADNTNMVNAQANVNIQGSILGSNVNLIQNKRAFNQTRNTDATLVTANLGDIILYTLSVQNTGNAMATNYVFQDNLSDVLQLSQLQDFSDGTFNIGNLSLVWPAVNINPGSTVTKTFVVKVNSTFAAGTDNIMTNTFGNTINVQVNKPSVLGVFISPKTGATTNIVFVLSLLTVAGFLVFKKKQQLKLLVNRFVRSR
jgi:uncharacterized repeat protein (TIGR01451 family)